MDWTHIIALWAAAWASHTFGMHLLNVFAGLLGGCLYVVLTSPALKMPKFNKAKEELELNFVGILLAAALCGFIIDYMPPVSFIGGALFPGALKIFFSKGIPSLTNAFIKYAASKVKDETDAEIGD